MKLLLEDTINVRFKNYKPTEITKGVVIGIKKIKMRFFKEEWYYYCLSPVEQEGYEHNDEEWFFDKELK